MHAIRPQNWSLYCRSYRISTRSCCPPTSWSRAHSGGARPRKPIVNPPLSDVPDHPLFNYTSGRWLYNKSLRLFERRQHFDVEALCDLTATAVGKSSLDINAFFKLAEGGSYRVFEAGFHDDLCVIVRLPYSSSVPRLYGVASEAATMEFLRLHGLPVPRIYAWDSSAMNAVGSEYMIMEKCSGQELDNTWYSMGPSERKMVVEKIVEFQNRLSALELPASGSIYFKNSLDASIPTIDIPYNGGTLSSREFCIGPSTETLWWYHKRDELDIARGPWTSTEEIFGAVASRETTWLQRFGKPRLPREPAYRSILKHELATPQDQIDNLLDFSKIAKLFLPTDTKLNKPTLCHPDISPNNVFITESGHISGVIDWEHSVALPMFLQAKMPSHFQNFGDEDSEAFKPPGLPEEFYSMQQNEKSLAEELYRRRQLHYYYLGFMHRDNQDFFQAILSPGIVTRNRLFEAASRPWEGDSTSLKAELIRATREWPHLVPSAGAESKWPVKYTEHEIDSCLAVHAKQQAADEQMQQLRDHLGVNIDGWIQSHMYDEAKIKEQNLKEQMLEAVDTDDERQDILKNWPFLDHDEID